MPIARVYVPEGLLTTEQRNEIIKGVAEVINQVEHRPPNAATFVLITEVPGSDWGFKGQVYQK